MNKRVHVYYSGNVQGVGFRFTAEDIAMSLGLTGWVKNLRDNQVEVTCEGDEKLLREFLQKIEGIFGRYIHNAHVEWAEATDEFSGFDIRF